jgi:hypothetical protein
MKLKSKQKKRNHEKEKTKAIEKELRAKNQKIISFIEKIFPWIAPIPIPVFLIFSIWRGKISYSGRWILKQEKDEFFFWMCIVMFCFFELLICMYLMQNTNLGKRITNRFSQVAKRLRKL